MSCRNKPMIGLTPSHDLTNDDISTRPTYLRAIKAAGGIPVVLPLEVSDDDLEQLVSVLDGFLFTGGPDVHPFHFGEQAQAFCGTVSASRDHQELKLLELIIKARKPLLGICRGIQVINIGLGGDIYQDIPSQFKEEFSIAHNQAFSYRLPAHHIEVVPETRLAEIAGTSVMEVNSMHHQAVRNVAPGLMASGYAPNGLVEAVEMPGYPFLMGVQWHPEYLWESDTAARRLFEVFVDACG